MADTQSNIPNYEKLNMDRDTFIQKITEYVDGRQSREFMTKGYAAKWKDGIVIDYDRGMVHSETMKAFPDL